MPLLLLTRYSIIFLSVSILAYTQTVSVFVVIDVRVLEQTDAEECVHAKIERKHLVISLSLLLTFYKLHAVRTNCGW